MIAITAHYRVKAGKARLKLRSFTSSVSRKQPKMFYPQFELFILENTARIARQYWVSSRPLYDSITSYTPPINVATRGNSLSWSLRHRKTRVIIKIPISATSLRRLTIAAPKIIDLDLYRLDLDLKSLTAPNSCASRSYHIIAFNSA